MLYKTTPGKIFVEHIQRNRSGESGGSQNSSLEGMLVYVWDLGWRTGQCRVEERTVQGGGEERAIHFHLVWKNASGTFRLGHFKRI